MLAKFSMKSLDILGGPQPVGLHRICSQQGSLVVEPQRGLLVEARRLLPNLTAHIPEALGLYLVGARGLVCNQQNKLWNAGLKWNARTHQNVLENIGLLDCAIHCECWNVGAHV